MVIKVVIDQVGTATASGWQFLLTGGCDGVAIGGSTGAGGTVTFNNLEATDVCGVPYIVTEVAANTSGFVTSPAAAQGVHVAPGETSAVTFTNSRGGPPPPPQDPTATPTTPATNTPVPTETVAGDITPGPGEPSPTTEPGSEATPIAPEAGTGFAGGASGANIALLLLGLFAITIGSGFLALARKR
jgi:hypothetical protein